MSLLNGHAIEAIFFDLDGTIADTDDALAHRAARWFRLVRLLLPAQDEQAAARRLVMRIETPMNALVGWLDRTGLDQLVGPIMDALNRLRGSASHAQVRIIPGVQAMLERLGRHYPLGVVTARESFSTTAILAGHALAPLFQCVATARTCRRAKPHPAPILWAVAQIGASPQHCLMVGDTPADIRAGKSAGLRTVGVLCGFGDRSELERAGADLILHSTADLADLLLGSDLAT
jgi:HAD superfamily hydrolase (TIGR01509 family)